MGHPPCAPVVLLGYRRPEMTAKVFAAILEAKPRVLLVVMDGPRPGDDRDAHQVSLTREAVATVDWDADVHRIYADTNMGLKVRVSTGLDEVFSLVDEAIILEGLRISLARQLRPIAEGWPAPIFRKNLGCEAERTSAQRAASLGSGGRENLADEFPEPCGVAGGVMVKEMQCCGV